MAELERGRIAANAVAEAQGRIPEWINVFSLCADATRMKILVALHAAPEASVSQLAEAAELSANTVTQALATLRRAGVVDVRPDGKYRRWRLVHPGVHQLLHQMDAPHSALHPEHRHPGTE
ncbi:metalloregulator ArsR/SmtB family transcription factor [Glutamicibacter sp. MNS18]|uniref:ArsR/SmtB family transcription factor n=1 Tax=Glutamicibacter sp. MNS18 TaxID=2989817 RepID=UPI0022368C29|nr:metalloregulator ArsR/SmtB family transcription factor [Glutamicibacter sp. MNS18]MCW4466069.1 metalloregulator ArsR/SmtB family transcription factor [Glutamicibacter sp. MNS18]